MSPDTQGSRIARLEQRSDDHEQDIKRVERVHEQDMRAFGGEVGKAAVLEVMFNGLAEKVAAILERLDQAEARERETKRYRVTTYIAAAGLLVMVCSVAVTVLALVLSQ